MFWLLMHSRCYRCSKSSVQTWCAWPQTHRDEHHFRHLFTNTRNAPRPIDTYRSARPVASFTNLQCIPRCKPSVIIHRQTFQWWFGIPELSTCTNAGHVFSKTCSHGCSLTKHVISACVYMACALTVQCDVHICALSSARYASRDYTL